VCQVHVELLPKLARKVEEGVLLTQASQMGEAGESLVEAEGGGACGRAGPSHVVCHTHVARRRLGSARLVSACHRSIGRAVRACVCS
jgi:hypothetical protein